jgi:tRNA (guanine37-N1)-methyltransferase
MKSSKLRIDILTLFPKLLEAPLDESMVRQAKKRGAVEVHVHDLRKHGLDKRRTCDDKPFGGGAGMVMMVQPIYDCLKTIPTTRKKSWRVLVSPRGKVFNHSIAKRLASKRHLVFVCGHYEGFDERVHEHLIDEEISAGDFVTTGGEYPALCFVDAVVRLVPGALGNHESLESESFGNGLLDFPQYTRPRSYQGWSVPEILISGDQKKVDAWRKREALELTKRHRPDLIQINGGKK